MLYVVGNRSSFSVGENIRDNVLMGETYIHKRYQKIMKLVELDLSHLPGGDQTQVLENGVNFSETDKRKIILARMLYVAGDIYILKDFFGYGEAEHDEKLYR